MDKKDIQMRSIEKLHQLGAEIQEVEDYMDGSSDQSLQLMSKQ